MHICDSRTQQRPSHFYSHLWWFWLSCLLCSRCNWHSPQQGGGTEENYKVAHTPCGFDLCNGTRTERQELTFSSPPSILQEKQQKKHCILTIFKLHFTRGGFWWVVEKLMIVITYLWYLQLTKAKVFISVKKWNISQSVRCLISTSSLAELSKKLNKNFVYQKNVVIDMKTNTDLHLLSHLFKVIKKLQGHRKSLCDQTAALCSASHKSVQKHVQNASLSNYFC